MFVEASRTARTASLFICLEESARRAGLCAFILIITCKQIITSCRARFFADAVFSVPETSLIERLVTFSADAPGSKFRGSVWTGWDTLLGDRVPELSPVGFCAYPAALCFWGPNWIE